MHEVCALCPSLDLVPGPATAAVCTIVGEAVALGLPTRHIGDPIMAHMECVEVLGKPPILDLRRVKACVFSLFLLRHCSPIRLICLRVNASDLS
jgi:hypothetical protein